MVKIEFYPQFAIQLKEIKAYLLKELQSHQASQNFEKLLAHKIKMLYHAPELGQRLEYIIPDLSNQFMNYYKLQVKNYLIIYQYLETENLVVVYYIFHSKQNYQKLFFNDV